jgi:hypothetical protein
VLVSCFEAYEDESFSQGVMTKLIDAIKAMIAIQVW